MVIKTNFQFQLGRWSVQIGNEHGDFRFILWRHHSSKYSSGSYARWQWNFRERPVAYRQEDMPVIEFVGTRIASMEIDREGRLREVRDDWPDTIDG